MLVVAFIENTEKTCLLDISSNENVQLLSQMIQAQLGVLANQQQLIHNGNIIKNGTESKVGNLLQLGLAEGSVITVKVISININSLNQIRNDITPDQLIDLVQQQPHLIEQFQASDPELASFLVLRDISSIRMLMMKRNMKHYNTMIEFEENIMDEKNQLKIEEAIKNDNINQNRDLAYENMPESFVSVNMLYVKICINNTHLKAFIDSGAQMTIMSAKCAEKCGLLRLLDVRFKGEARGVGTAKILGKVHIAQLKFANSYFPISITVLEHSDIEFLFGLDMLRRYQCCIDLRANVLRMNKGSNSNEFEELPFLSESEMVDEKDKIVLNDNYQSDSMKIDTNASDLDAKIKQLEILGFSNSQAKLALQQSNNDVDAAAALLFESI